MKNANYIDRKHKVILAERKDGTIVTVPADPVNRDYRLIVEGDTEANIKPIVIKPYVADVVRLRQKTRLEAIEAALIKKGLLSNADITRETIETTPVSR